MADDGEEEVEEEDIVLELEDLYALDDEYLEAIKDEIPRGVYLAVRDDLDFKDLMDMYGIFYTMDVWSRAVGKHLDEESGDRGLQGMRGAEFKVGFMTRVSEASEQYTPFDFYAKLKEGIVPDIHFTPLQDSLPAIIEDMESDNARREKRGWKKKYSRQLIDLYKSTLEEAKELNL